MDLYEWAKMDSVLGPCTCWLKWRRTAKINSIARMKSAQHFDEPQGEKENASRVFFTQRFRTGLSSVAPPALKSEKRDLRWNGFRKT